MNPTQRKIVIGTGILILANLLVILSLMSSKKAKPIASRDVSGFWQGAIQVEDRALRLVLKLARDAQGAYAATVDSVDQGIRDIPIQVASFSNETLHVELRTIGATYEGKLAPDGSHFAGEWRQATAQLPLTLTRTNDPFQIAAPLAKEAIAPRPDSDLQGYWTGTLKAGPASLRVAIKVAEPKPGSFTATFDSLDQGAHDLPIQNFTFQKPGVQFELSSVGGLFEGDLNGDRSEIAGTWSQGGRGMPLVLKRSTPAAELEKPPASAFQPNNSLDLPGYWRGEIQVNGTLTLHLALQIARTGPSNYSGSLDSLDQGARNLPTSAITVTNQDVTLAWDGIGARFHGIIENNRLTGNWKQGPASLPVSFVRTNAP